MRQQQEQVKTSVFSEYQNNQNDSISSRQLQFWLKQTAPTSHPRTGGLQWTLMSTNSVFEQQEHVLQRNQTFQSLGKENDYSAFNSARPTSYNSSGVMKSKSYVNAMVDLQNKVKQLETQNGSLKHMVHNLKEQKNKAMTESTHVKQELKSRLEVLEPKTKKMEELIRDNKMLRETREESLRKAKILDKVNKEDQLRFVEYEKEMKKLKQELKVKNDKATELEKENEESTKIIEKNKETLSKLQAKNKELQSMKEKSTSSIIEKYNKSVDMSKELEIQKMHLKEELQYIKEKCQDNLKEADERNRRDREEYTLMIERLKQELLQKRQTISDLTKNQTYFREKYEETNNQLKQILKSHTQQILKMKEVHENEVRSLRNQPKQKEIVYIEKRVEQKKQEIDLNKQSQIKPQIVEEKQIESHLQFEQFDQEEEEEEDEQREELHQYETRSLEKQTPKYSIVKKSKHKPSDCHSQQYRQLPSNAKPKSSAKRSGNIMNTKSKRGSNEKNLSSAKLQKSKSREKSKEKVQHFEQDHSFILKSCQPMPQHEHVEQLRYSNQPIIYNSANHPTRQKVPHYWQNNDIADFASSQRGTNGDDKFLIEKALIAQKNKEALRLLEQQQRLMELNHQNICPNQKSEIMGRMKQISKQMNLNDEKILELKKVAYG